MRQRDRWKKYVKSRNKLRKRVSISTRHNFDYRNSNVFKPLRKNIVYIKFPSDCRFIKNYDNFNRLVNDIIDKSNDQNLQPIEWFDFDLKDVTLLDSAAINVLLTLVNYLSLFGFRVKGNVPGNPDASNFMAKSGFFAMVKSSRKVPDTDDHFFTLAGNNKTNQDAIADEIHNIMYHLTGEKISYQPLYNTLGEVAGNSVEHSNKEKTYKNWFMSVHYEDSSAMIMMADIGKGILGTLNLLLKQKVYEQLANNEPHETLKKLFEGKFQSSTRDPNRNNGLPEMMERVSRNYIKNVIVVTNNAVLDLNGKLSCKLNISFPGTFYLIEVTKENYNLWSTREKQ